MKTLGIDGIAKSTIQLFDKNNITNIKQLINCEKSDFMKMERIKDKSANNM